MVDILPYLPVVSLAKSGTTKTASGFDPGNAEFNILECRISQIYDGIISKITMKIEDDAGTHLSFMKPGGTYSIQWGKTVGSLSTLTQGFVDARKIERKVGDQMEYTLTCLDRNTLQDRRLVNVSRFQKRTSAGNLDETDTSMDLGNLVKFIIGYDTDGSTAVADAYYPMNKFSNVKTLANEYSISASGIQLANFKLPTFNAEYRMSGDVIKEIAEHKDYLAYIDESDVFQFRPKTSVDSGILITSALSPTWDTTKVAHIVDDEDMAYEETLEDTRNLIVGVGGELDTPTYSQTTVSGGSDTLHDQYIAFKLPAIKDTGVTAVAVWVDRTATAPDIDLFGELREDNGNTPQGGGLVKGFQIGRSSIKTTGNWVLADLSADVNTQVDHWLILYKDLGGTGSASKSYNWYHAGGSSGTYATSTDGATWSVTGSSKSYAFLLWVDSRVISVIEDATSIADYGQRDMLLSDTAVKSTSTMENRLSELIKQKRNMKEVFTGTIFPPDTIIPVGKTVTIQDTLAGIGGTFKVLQADYVFHGVGALSVEVTATKVFP